MKKLIQNIKMAGLMAMALIAWPTTITAQSAKYDAKTVNAVTERFVAYAKINSQGTDTSDMDAFPLNPGQREMARKVEADLQAILRGTSATVTRSESEYVYVKIPANAKGIPSVMFMAHLDVTPEAPGGNITPVVHRGYDGGDLHLPSGLVLSPTTPQGRHLAQCVGKTVITSDGSTVLGADDKTGCTVLVTLIERITRNRKMRHGDLYFVFSQNEDIGRAADRFEVKYVGGGSPDVVIDIDGESSTEVRVRMRYFDKLEGDTLRTMLNDAEASVKTAYPNVRVEATPEVLQYENVAYSMPSSLTQLIVKSAKECSLTLKPRSERGGTTSAMMAAKGLRGGPCLYSGQQAEHSVYEWTCVEDMLQMTDVAEAIVRNIAREGGSFYIK